MNIKLNPGGILGALIGIGIALALKFGLVRVQFPVIYSASLFGFVGGFAGNACWEWILDLYEYLFPTPPDPEELELARKESWRHPSRAEEREALIRRMSEKGIGGEKESQFNDDE
ncbi:MAG: hypothetical protein KDA69_05605 [Planctomycetaceae bacterium]|nr:hypothetical protein [Planctomycetaceae bacterium]MCA9043775.1 hypothetical protein [Planctomycetaceae bacterium]